MSESEIGLASKKHPMLLKDSVLNGDPTFLSETTTFLPKRRARTARPPLPALAKEVLWYGHEKKFNESHNIPFSPFIARHQRLSASIDNNNIGKMPPISKSSLTLRLANDIQAAKQKRIAQLVRSQIKKFEDAHENHDKSILSRQFRGSKWFNESYDDAVIDYYDARKDQKELDNLRFRAWKAGARWRHAELVEYMLGEHTLLFEVFAYFEYVA